mgnify:CR=1 FL=1
MASQEMSSILTVMGSIATRLRLISMQKRMHFLKLQSPRLQTRKEQSLMESNFVRKKGLELQMLY